MSNHKKTYDACAAWMAGDVNKAAELGLKIKNLSDANRLMTEAFKALSAAERTSDFWEIMQKQNAIKLQK